jgi:hypothetical protein
MTARPLLAARARRTARRPVTASELSMLTQVEAWFQELRLALETVGVEHAQLVLNRLLELWGLFAECAVLARFTEWAQRNVSAGQGRAA